VDTNSFGFASVEERAVFHCVNWPLLLGGGNHVDKLLRCCALGSALEVRVFKENSILWGRNSKFAAIKLQFDH
jgi:hypothetical protein